MIEDVDAAVIEAGRAIADQIDWAKENSTGGDLSKALYLTPHLVNILKELLATPAARRSAGMTGEESAGGTLSQLRKKRRAS